MDVRQVSDKHPLKIAAKQWRIQDFPDEGGANFWQGGKNQLFHKIFTQNCLKMKEIGPKGVPTWIRHVK